MEVNEGILRSGAAGDSMLDGQALVTATASELSAPLVLLRQLSLALASGDLTKAERDRLVERMALVSERALRTARTLAFQPDAQPLIALEPVNAITLCNEVVHELTPLFRAHGKSIAVRKRTKSPLLIADRTLLRRLLVSLGDNALHFSPESKPTQLTITSHCGHVRVGVRDYGPAVPNDIWNQLEGRIARRSVVPLPRRPQSSGVGLLMARRIASAMGGAVGVTRHRDGATFYVDMRLSGQMNLL